MTPLSEEHEKSPVSNKRPSGRGFMKKAIAGLAAAATLAGGMVVGTSTAVAADHVGPTTSYDRTLGNASFEAARKQYGLSKEMDYGAILHAWMWSANTIKNNMQAIADAGYTSIQTVPMSTIKGPVEGMKFTKNWYYVYQPTGTGIGNKVIGTEAEIKAMTEEAHKHGIRIIADAVINHFSSDWNAIESNWQDKNLFHTRNGICGGQDGDQIDYSNRWKVTQCHLLGLWDLNTQSQEVSNRMKDYLTRAVADGVDGFRYDAAKHIELPDEFEQHSPYFDTILPNGAQYQYGEVLQGDTGLNVAAYPALFDKYSSNGGGNTGSNYGKAVRGAVRSGRMNANSLRNLQGQGVKDNQLVTWVESHDNYANDDRESTGMTAQQIRLGWGIIGSRAGGAPLFFNRPVGSGGSNPQFSEQTQLGSAGDDEWKSPEVVAVNKFRNAMEGAPENLANCGDDSCLMIQRYVSDGADNNDGVTVVNSGGDRDLNGTAVVLDNGTYKDQVHGGSITVKDGKIVSGQAKGGSVSVFFNGGGQVGDVEYLSAAPGSTTFTGNSIDVKISMKNVTNAQYSTSDGKSGSIEDGTTITIGAGAEIGDVITLTLTGKGTGTTQKDFNVKYTYEKTERAAQNLAKYYSTNLTGQKNKKTITVDGNVNDWDSSMIIAQGAANDDPRVYRENSMYEVPIDLYTLYGTWDDTNLYLMWEMTNVQDYVDPGDNYPIGRPLFGELNCPVWIVLDTGRSDNKIGKNLNLTTGGTIWASNNQWEQSINNLVAISYNGANGPWMYGGDENGLSSAAIWGPGADPKTGTQKTNMKFKYGKGILSKEVWGIDGGWGTAHNRVPGDMKNDNANWVEFNSKGHNSAAEDVNYEMSIPLEELGITADDVAKTGVGVQIVATMGLSGMDSLPYDLAANDNADLPDTTSQENNSYEKSDDDSYSAPLARIGAAGGPVITIPVDSVTINQGDSMSIDLGVSRTAQLSATVAPSNASSKKVTWTSSDDKIATVDSKGNVKANKAGTVTITAKAGDKTDTITITVTGELVIPTTTTVYYPSSGFGANSTYLHYRVNKGGAAGTWTTVPGVKMEAACDGYVKYTIDNPDQDEVEFVFNNGAGQWDNNGEKNYKGTGESLLVKSGQLTVDNPPCTVTVPVSSVSIAGGDFSLTEGASKQFSATVSPSNATDRAISWKSSDASVASVDASGKVTAVKAGSATVTATAGGKSASVEVTVTKQQTVVPVESVSISGTGVSGGKATINVGAGLSLNATVAPSNATDRTVAWKSTNAAIASVDANGNVRGLKAGSAGITATAGGKSASITVTVKDGAPVPVLQSIAISGSGIAGGEMTMKVGENRKLTAVPTPSNASVAGATWSSLDDSVATVDGNGKVTAKSEGLTMIMVEVGGHSDSVLLTVSGRVDPVDSRFSDVPKSHHFYADIEWLASSGVTTGFGDGTFRPSEDTSRAQTVVFLHRLAVQRGDKEAANYSPSAADYARFPDVDRDSFGARQILWAASKGITTGRADGSFGGDAAVTRDQMVTFLCRFAAVEGDAGAKSFAPSAADYARFSDVNRGTFAAREILWGASVGIVNGKDGKFSGGDSALREQMAAFLHRLDTHLG
ncbi:Ig-like domain-containing protein [Bifidobacterium choerinum]|uniref:Putative S-layer y domain protein n=5 Tax=Bifidobacterium choerinum TaxID=35760 RepID=A0A087ADX0_9BIFI|nr:Ig-like domain-containing protein [Bifidobacterium choerinum]KFI56970.1 putative S-layer y domain protein [Bifidobacterium choerinum]